MSDSVADEETPNSTDVSNDAVTMVSLFRQLSELGVTPRSIRVGQVEVQVANVVRHTADEDSHVVPQPNGYLARAMHERQFLKPGKSNAQ